MGLLDILGGSGARRGGGMSPIILALLGLLAYRTFQGKGRPADMPGTPDDSGAPATGGGLGDPPLAHRAGSRPDGGLLSYRLGAVGLQSG
jgi:hypothetical protein